MVKGGIGLCEGTLGKDVRFRRIQPFCDRFEFTLGCAVQRRVITAEAGLARGAAGT